MDSALGFDFQVHCLSAHGAELRALDLKQACSRNVHAVLVVVQSLCRPLKEGEARSHLCRRARVLTSANGSVVPAKLQLFLDAAASATEAPPEAPKTAAAAAVPSGPPAKKQKKR